jgi:hypothetical protein
MGKRMKGKLAKGKLANDNKGKWPYTLAQYLHQEK